MPNADQSKSGSHGAAELPSVIVDSYNLELSTEDGFIGDRASRRAFVEIIEDWRQRLKRVDSDPLGNVPTEKIKKKQLDELLKTGDPEAAGLVHGAVEEFAQELADVFRKFLRTDGWQGTQRIAIGGGFRESRIGELALGRAMVLLKADGLAIDLVPIRHHPDEAGLIGSVHLLPAWMLSAHDAVLAVDIGGTNIRAGIVELKLAKAPDLSKASVFKSELWRHGEEKPNREQAVQGLVEMLEAMLAKAKAAKLRVAPFIGVGCPGLIERDGSIARGGQNLPGGNWESGGFNLANELRAAIPKISDHDTMVMIHNDAVVQGLSEVPFMKDISHWGIATIGTGLGNARFTNRN